MTIEPNFQEIPLAETNSAAPQPNTPAVTPSGSNVTPAPNGSILNGGSLYSPNFSKGNSGWSINAAGDVEFNDGNFRGDITGASGTFTGTLTGGSLNIPDATTANSMHVNTTGDTWWGATTFAAALASISKVGAAIFSNATITGGSVATSVLNTSVMRATSNITFTSTDNDTITWSAGNIRTAAGVTYTISGGNTGVMAALTYIYLDTAISTTVLQTTTVYSTAVGDGKILVATAQNETSGGAYCIPFLGGAPLMNGAAQINASSILAAQMSVSQLSAIAADMGAITAGTITLPSGGYIRSGQTAYDTGTGFYIGNDLGTPKLSIGVSTGNKITWNGTDFKITSNTVNGITMEYGSNILLEEGGNIKFTSLVAPVACVATLIVTGTGNVDNGTHSYKIIYVNATGETELGSISNVVTVDASNKQVSLSSIPISSSGGVTSRKIYRTKAGGTSYFLLTTISDNTTTTYTDNTTDANLTGLYANFKQNDSFGKILVDGVESLSLGSLNTLVGANAGNLITTGKHNVALGTNSIFTNTDGWQNTAIGALALYSTTLADNNTAIGFSVLYSNTTGSNNTSLGFQSLYYNTTGYQNLALGRQAGMRAGVGNNQTSNNSIYIGYGVGASADGNTNETVIGIGINGSGSNTVTIGNTSVTSTFIRGIINIKTKTPASATDTGTTGDIAWDASFIYVCTATNTWKRVGIAAW